MMAADTGTAKGRRAGKTGRIRVIELYHNGMSVCSQKVRLVLAEKGLDYTPHHLRLREGDQFAPEYRRLNPAAVVPTLVHDGAVIRESTVIMEYLDELFPEPPLKPADAATRARMRVWTKAMDEGVHAACANIAYATAYRGIMRQKSAQELEAHFARMPDPERSERQRQAIERGLDAPVIRRSVLLYDRTMADMEAALADHDWLVGDGYSLADVALTPYVLRVETMWLEELLFRDRARVAGWLKRIKARANFAPAVSDQMPAEPIAALKAGGDAARDEMAAILSSV
jgi:glutathione S-transferase